MPADADPNRSVSDALCMRYCRAGTLLRATLEHSYRYTPNYLRKFAAVCLEPPADSDLEDVLAEGTAGLARLLGTLATTVGRQVPS